MYSVNLWGSDPAAGNDDCWTGKDFATLAEAQTAFDDPASAFPHTFDSDTHTIELDGPDAHRTRTNPGFRPEHSDDDWRTERAMQAGMAFGCQGYNDEMGY
jgi:hypothetical protein